MTLGIASSDTTAGTVSNASLTFTPDNWNVPQTVTIMGVDDYLADGDRAYQIVFAAVSADGNYNGLQAANVAVTDLAYVAVTRTWDGNAADDLWTTPGNWVGGAAPHPSDRLVFPDGQQNQAFNDFPASTAFTSLTFQNAAGFSVGETRWCSTRTGELRWKPTAPARRRSICRSC